MMDPTEKQKMDRIGKRPPDDARVRALENWRDTLEKDIREIRHIRTDLAEYVFQTVAIVISIFSLIITIALGFVTNFEFNNDMKLNILLGLIISIFIILIVWLILWSYKNIYWKPTRR